MMSVKMNDGTIVELFWSRDELAINEFDKQYRPLCLKLARDITGSDGTAEECLNDLYLRLWNAIPPEKPQSLKSYACRIIRNLALQVMEKQHAQKRSAILVELDECLCDLPDMDSGEIGKMIDTFLAGLPRLEALIFVRRYFYSDSVERIAAKIGFAENKVSKILAKTRKALRVCLEEGGISI